MLLGIQADDYRQRRARLLVTRSDSTDADVHSHIINGIPVAHLATLLKTASDDAHA